MIMEGWWNDSDTGKVGCSEERNCLGATLSTTNLACTKQSKEVLKIHGILSY